VNEPKILVALSAAAFAVLEAACFTASAGVAASTVVGVAAWASVVGWVSGVETTSSATGASSFTPDILNMAGKAMQGRGGSVDARTVVKVEKGSVKYEGAQISKKAVDQKERLLHLRTYLRLSQIKLALMAPGAGNYAIASPALLATSRLPRRIPPSWHLPDNSEPLHVIKNCQFSRILQCLNNG
jgi:hypothetical protein